jgi:hypothetical protein
MRIPTWRLALTGGAIVILLALGLGLVAARPSSPSQPSTAAAAASLSPDASAAPDANGPLGQRLRSLLERWQRFGVGHRLVHATATVLDKDGNLVQLQLDHGTVQAMDGGSITVAEAGGTTVTVTTDSATVVRIGHDKGTLADLKVGDQVFVHSRIDAGTTLAKHILEVPTATT